MDQNSIVARLLDKAKEAFILAIETIPNKPTIHYRLEAFSFLICNAWELMLKAHLINKLGENSIYFPEHPERTISLQNCLQRVFTNDKSPLRLNMARIMELRNTSTHYITEEYEMVYIPLLQACVNNFIEKMSELHSIDMTEFIQDNFITLSTSIRVLDEKTIRGKYPEQISEKLINTHKELTEQISQNNSHFAIRIEHRYFLTKKREEATELYAFDNSSGENIRIVKDIRNPSDTHGYSFKRFLEEIRRLLKQNRIILKLNGTVIEKFNSYHLRLLIKYYSLKSNEKYAYKHTVLQQGYSYSYQAIQFIYDELKRDPENILGNIKVSLEKNKKS